MQSGSPRPRPLSFPPCFLAVGSRRVNADTPKFGTRQADCFFKLAVVSSKVEHGLGETGLMRFGLRLRRNWRVAFVALLTLAFTVAPIAAQSVMSAATLASPHQHASLDHDASTGTHDHAAHTAMGHHHHGSETLGHNPDGATADSSAAPPLSGQHDHDDGAGCCGTFCHSVVDLPASTAISTYESHSAYGWLILHQRAAVDPGQPQRPPLHLRSM